MIAAEALRKEQPDDYNFMVSNNAPFTIAPTQFKNIAYDPVRDFTHIAYLGSTYGGCVANALKELAISMRDERALIAPIEPEPAGGCDKRWAPRRTWLEPSGCD